MSQYFQDPDDADASLPVAQVITVPGVLTGTTAGLTVQNTSAATVGAQVQRSPSAWQYGTGWDTDDAVSRTFGMGWQMRPVAGATVTGALHLMRDLAGTVADAGLSITSAATIHWTYPATMLSSNDNAGTARTHIAYGLSTNQLDVGSGTGVTKIIGANSSTDSIYLYSLGTPICILGTGIMDMRWPEVRFVSSTAAMIRHQNLSSGSGQAFIVRAQGTSAASGNGGRLTLDGGRRGAGGSQGGVVLRLNDTDSAFDPMVEVVSLGGRRVLGLVAGTDISTTQMPANTGDRVAFLADASTAPTANAVGGGILYSEAGALKWRGSAGTITTLGAA